MGMPPAAARRPPSSRTRFPLAPPSSSRGRRPNGAAPPSPTRPAHQPTTSSRSLEPRRAAPRAPRSPAERGRAGLGTFRKRPGRRRPPRAAASPGHRRRCGRLPRLAEGRIRRGPRASSAALSSPRPGSAARRPPLSSAAPPLARPASRGPLGRAAARTGCPSCWLRPQPRPPAPGTRGAAVGWGPWLGEASCRAGRAPGFCSFSPLPAQK